MLCRDLGVFERVRGSTRTRALENGVAVVQLELFAVQGCAEASSHITAWGPSRPADSGSECTHLKTLDNLEACGVQVGTVAGAHAGHDAIRIAVPTRRSSDLIFCGAAVMVTVHGTGLPSEQRAGLDGEGPLVNGMIYGKVVICCSINPDRHRSRSLSSSTCRLRDTS
jgi:hypothetical protein